jgi:hypothetical protein
MNNIKKIILGLACMGFGSAYAFTATQSSCESYINGSSSNTFTINDAAKIHACLEACPTLYGNGVDANTLQNIMQCKRNLSALRFVSNVSMENMQNSASQTGNNTFTPAPVQAQNTVAPPAPSVPVSQPTPVAPATPSAPVTTQNNSDNKSNNQIKWF